MEVLTWNAFADRQSDLTTESTEGTEALNLGRTPPGLIGGAWICLTCLKMYFEPRQ